MECADRDWLLTSELVREEAHKVLTQKFPKRADAARLFDAAWREAGLVEDADGPRDDNDALAAQRQAHRDARHRLRRASASRSSSASA